MSLNWRAMLHNWGYLYCYVESRKQINTGKKVERNKRKHKKKQEITAALINMIVLFVLCLLDE